MIHKLKKLGFSEERLATLINVFIDFVNNCSKDKFTELMSTELNEIDMVILKALFRGENNHFDILLKSLADKIDSDEHCEIILDILKNMLLSEQVEVLCAFSSEVNLVIMQIQFLSSSEKSLKAAIRVLAALNEMKSDRGIGTPRFISLGLLQRTRCWRRYSFADLKLLNGNPNVECWHFTEIVLDWLKSHHEQNDDYMKNLNCSREMINDRINSNINKNEFISLEEYRDIISEELDYLFSNTQESFVQNYRRLYSELGFWKFCGRVICDVISSVARATILIIKTFFLSGNWLIPIGFFFLAVILNLVCHFVKYTSERLPESDTGLLKSCILITIVFSVLTFLSVALIVNREKIMMFFINIVDNLRSYKKKVEIRLLKERVDDFVGSSVFPLKLKPICELRELVFFKQYAELKLLNKNGMAEVDLKGPYIALCYPVCHWFLRPYFLDYDKSERPFYSLFTNSHSEIVQYLKERNEKLSSGFLSKYRMLLVHYLVGRSPLHICTLSKFR